MRPIWSPVRRRALGMAFAITWASGVQLSGCLNSSARELTTDLTENASKAALQAELDVAEQKHKAAIAKAESKQEKSADSSRMELAGAEEKSPEVAKTAAAEGSRLGAFRKLLWGKESSPAKEDPFESPKVESKDPFQDYLAERERVAKEFPETTAKRSPKTDDADKSWDALVAASRKPAPAKEVAEPLTKPVPEFAAEADEDFAWARVSSTKPAEKATAASVETAAPVTESPAAPAAASAWDEWELARTRQQDNSTPQTTALTDQQRQQRLKMTVLLSEAHTHVMRGELHAAYRCALLAEQVASASELNFGPRDENPHELARAIAAKIWNASNTPGGEALALGENFTEEAAAPTSPPPARDIFGGGSDFANWTPQGSAQQGSGSWEGQNVEAPATSELPQIRAAASQDPWQTTPSIAAAKPSPAPAVRNEVPFAGWKQSPPSVVDDQFVNSSATGADDRGVQFAIAHTISRDATSPLSPQPAPQLAPAPPEFPAEQQAYSVAAATLDINRPALIVPPTLETPPPAESDAGNYMWDELSRAEQGTKTASASRPSLQWGMMGFIAAILATLIGARLARRSQSRQTAKSSEGSESPPQERKFRIKRAA